MKLGLALLMTLISWAWVQSASAQWYPYGARPVRTVDRWLGVGYSAGYHTQNPGPDSDYYQPYSDVNSSLQSWLPADSRIQPTPARLPEESPAPNYSPQDLGLPGAAGEARQREYAPWSGQPLRSGPFGWASGSSGRPEEPASRRGNSSASGNGPRMSRMPFGNMWR